VRRNNNGAPRYHEFVISLMDGRVAQITSKSSTLV